MKNLGKLVIATLILLSAVGSVAASPAELRVFPERSSTEINSFTSYELELENVGPVADVYTLSSTSSEVTIAPQRVPEQEGAVVEPGQMETINVWYNPGPEKEAGVHSFTVTATSRATGKKYSVDAEVEVIKDHQVSLDIDDSITVCRGEQAVYDVEVSNDGIQAETFKLTTRAGSLSQDEVTLQPNETQTVQVAVSSETPTEKNFNIIAASTTSYAQAIKNVQFKSEICYASDISITPETKDVAAKTETEIDVTVRNTGTKEDEFVLSSNVGEFDDSTVDIDGGESETVTLTVTPEELGEQTIEVTAKSQVTTTATTTLNVVNEMDAEVAFEEDTSRVCENTNVNLEAEITNTGPADETFTLNVNRGNLSDTEIDIDAGDTETVDVELATHDLAEGSYPVQITATASTYGEPVRNDTTSLVVENCYDLTMNVVPKVMSAGENRSVVYEVQLTNNGTRENTYEMSYEGPEWVSIKPEEITVESGESDKAYIYAGIPFNKKGEVKITANAVGTQVNKSETVTLLIGKEIEEAIKDSDNDVSGDFASQLPIAKVDLGSNLNKIVASLIAGLLITAAVLYREW